jgi:hypothetical protein
MPSTKTVAQILEDLKKNKKERTKVVNHISSRIVRMQRKYN